MANEIKADSLSFEMRDKIDFYLEKMLENNASDLHVKAGSIIRARVNGKIVPFSYEAITKKDALTLAKEMLIGRFQNLVEDKSIDFTYIVKNRRFRVNMFFQIDGVSAVFRTIADQIPQMEELGLPQKVNDFTNLNRGIVLVTGPTGSGKSTTLASMINKINKEQFRHIITVEDPIEFVYKEENCIINQRAIGQDALTFANSLKAALREDPDIILIGEMRDPETIEMALHAAETGHLVLSTLHTSDAKETISRIASMFSGNEQNRVRSVLASTLKGVVSQRLVKTASGGRIAAMEILVTSARIETLIRDSRDNEITQALKDGTDTYGTQTFDQSLLKLVHQGIIEEAEALAHATNPSDLKLHFLKTEEEDEKNTDDSNYIGLKYDS